MQTKLTVKQNIVTGIRNAMGLGKRRGGAGAVAAALAVCAIVASLTISVVGESTIEKISLNETQPDGEIPERADDFQPISWEKPLKEETIVQHNCATPERLPC